MLKDITLGQYFPGNTVVHRLDPRTKLIAVVLYIAALFTAIMLWLPGKLSDGLRLCTNTLLILLFIGHIVYHDFPVGQLPIIGKYFRK